MNGGFLTGVAVGLGATALVAALRARRASAAATRRSPPSSVPPPHVLLLVNGELETSALVEEFRATQRELEFPTLPFGRLYRTPDGVSIFSMGSMVGEEAVVAALFALLSSDHDYALVVLLGSCGALTSTGLGIGDVIAAYPTTCYFERRIAAFGPVSKRFGIGETMTWEYTDIVAKLTAEDLRVAAFPVRVIGAKIASGRSLRQTPPEFQWMHDMDVTGKDMEAAGVLSTCRQFGVAATALKVVVDLVADEGTLSSSKCDVMTAYDQNLPRCVVWPLTRAATVFVHRAQEQLQRAARQAMLFQQATRADPSSAPDVIAIHVAMSEEARPVAESMGLQQTVLARFAVSVLLLDRDVSAEAGGPGLPWQRSFARTESRVDANSDMLRERDMSVVQEQARGRHQLWHCGSHERLAWTLAVWSSLSKVEFIDARGLEGRPERRRKEELHVWREASEAVAATLEGAHVGTVGTGSSFDLSASDLASLKSLRASCVRKWRLPSVVWACNRFGVPVIVLKSVTDIVEHAEDGASEFTQNLWGKALETLAAAMPRVLSAVVGVMAVMI